MSWEITCNLSLSYLVLWSLAHNGDQDRKARWKSPQITLAYWILLAAQRKSRQDPHQHTFPSFQWFSDWQAIMNPWNRMPGTKIESEKGKENPGSYGQSICNHWLTHKPIIRLRVMSQASTSFKACRSHSLSFSLLSFSRFIQILFHAIIIKPERRRFHGKESSPLEAIRELG